MRWSLSWKSPREAEEEMAEEDGEEEEAGTFLDCVSEAYPCASIIRRW